MSPKNLQASAAGVSFYEFLVCARRVRETQLQQVAEYVETICGEGENFIEARVIRNV